MNWLYQNKPIQSIAELPNSEALFGFVYKITCLMDGKFYIGRKNFHSKLKKKLTQKEISTDKRLKTYKHVTKESTWLNYYSSCTGLIEDVKTHGPAKFKREIIHLAHSPKELTYLEMEYMFKHNVLRVKNCYNDNIFGKFFKKDLNIVI